ncbi:unnamed protein product [Miscanthus lutarioriparius]|uniref:Calmodulin binding protein-like N-terminal domain-containing protein n=1 Tax=Miscanthus lutarioriparius TaxID=422564 RepID=A0A811PXN3_9POAL|nr:unnamed protein product [Miscanthus lutarioriparius]
MIWAKEIILGGQPSRKDWGLAGQKDEVIFSTASRRLTCSQGKVIIQMLSEIKEEIRKQSKQLTESKEDISKLCKQLDKLTKSRNDQTRKLEKLTESHNDLCKQLKLHTNSTSGDGSHAPRSQPSQIKSPSYRLVFRSQVAEKIEKGQSIEISVALVDSNSDQTVENGPLASATVELVVINAEFNQHDNQYNWSREDFESNVKKSRQGNPTMGDADQPVKSIVSNGRFNLVHGAKLHSGSTIFSNSSNKKVRLGVMVVLPTEERVLEGLSNPFYVRGHDRPARQSNLRHNRSNRQRQDITGGQSQVPFLGKTTMLSTELPTSQEQQALILQYQVPHLPMLVQTMNSQTGTSLLFKRTG